MRYGKPAISLPDQLAKLKSRGLAVADDAAALDRLANLGYYRLSAYSFPFLIPPGRVAFKAGTTLEQVLRLYDFDRALRLLTIDAVERIEVAVRSRIVNETCRTLGNAHWFMDPAHFHSSFRHRDFIAKVEKELRIRVDRRTGRKVYPTSHPEVFVSHYYRKYGDPDLPPFWMTAELLPLGTLSRVYAAIASRPLRKKIAGHFFVSEVVFSGWLHATAAIRNVCAHHSRLWNRSFSVSPPIAKRHRSLVPHPQRYYAHAVVLMDMLRHADASTQWGDRLKQLFADYPEIDATAMGFPPGWETEPLWKP